MRGSRSSFPAWERIRIARSIASRPPSIQIVRMEPSDLDMRRLLLFGERNECLWKYPLRGVTPRRKNHRPQKEKNARSRTTAAVTRKVIPTSKACKTILARVYASRRPFISVWFPFPTCIALPGDHPLEQKKNPRKTIRVSFIIRSPRMTPFGI